ncbi:MAG: hypothetical protein NZ932_02585 [Candidatus Bathyarchaeota archaeon]|nr:hypothetical protein [Candidatus Bathyarchaeota archaeon]
MTKREEVVVSKKPPSKDDALEALDFIINVLREHEKDLDRLINELGKITEKLGEAGELSGKIESVEGRLTNLQSEISNLISYLSTSQVSSETPKIATAAPPLQKAQAVAVELRGPPVILRCKYWEDFKTLACQAHTLSFLYKEAEKAFQVDALKNNQIITYSGELPKQTALLKSWLSKQLNVPEERILEGILAVG